MVALKVALLIRLPGLIGDARLILGRPLGLLLLDGLLRIRDGTDKTLPAG